MRCRPKFRLFNFSKFSKSKTRQKFFFKKTGQKLGKSPENTQNSGWTSVTGSAHVENFFEKIGQKVTYAQFFAALQETFRGKDENFFSVLREIVPHFFEKAPNPLQETMVSRIFHIFSPFFLFFHWKIWKNMVIRKILKIFAKNIFSSSSTRKLLAMPRRAGCTHK